MPIKTIEVKIRISGCAMAVVHKKLFGRVGGLFLKKSPFLLFFFLIFLDLFGLFSLSCSRLIGFPVKSTVTNLSASWSVSGLFNICVDNIFFLDDYVISFPVFYHLQILQCTHNIVSINCPFITERLKWNEGVFFFHLQENR